MSGQRKVPVGTHLPVPSPSPEEPQFDAFATQLAAPGSSVDPFIWDASLNGQYESYRVRALVFTDDKPGPKAGGAPGKTISFVRPTVGLRLLQAKTPLNVVVDSPGIPHLKFSLDRKMLSIATECITGLSHTTEVGEGSATYTFLGKFALTNDGKDLWITGIELLAVQTAV